MILERHYLGCLSQASYLIGDAKAGMAAVVDPRRDVDVYIEAARKHGVEIRWVILTHFHADFVSGHIELRERTGAVICAGARARAEYEFRPLEDGDEIALGAVRLRALATPGHTPESICVLVFDGKAEAPHAVLTGDTLFIGDVGRPDLMASVGVTAEQLATELYDSIHGKLLTLPDATLVYPGHGAGSLCGKSLGKEASSTIGAQRAVNPALRRMARAEFIALVTAGQPKVPQYFAADADLNRRERPTLDAVVARALRPLPLEDVLRRRNQGVVVLDCRPDEEFTRGHLAGSVWIGLDGKFASWAGTVLRLDQPLILVTAPGDETEAATRLARIGHDAIEGCLQGGFATVAARPDLIERSRRCSPDELRAELRAEPARGNARAAVVDLRTPGEWDAGHIETAKHVPLLELQDRLAELPRDREVTLICGSGYRSLIATSLLAGRGYAKLRDVEGGMAAWNGEVD